MAIRKAYMREFKIEAVKLVTEQGVPRTHVALALGLDIGTLRHWLDEVTADGERAFPSPGLT
jgi:transposase